MIHFDQWTLELALHTARAAMEASEANGVAAEDCRALVRNYCRAGMLTYRRNRSHGKCKAIRIAAGVLILLGVLPGRPARIRRLFAAELAMVRILGAFQVLEGAMRANRRQEHAFQVIDGGRRPPGPMARHMA